MAQPTIQHVTSNLLIDLDGDHANVRGNLVVFVAPPSEANAPALAPQPQYTVGEIYRITVVRTPDGWRLSRLETVPVWLSGHLDRVPRTA